jgi:hypothetical protein
MAACTHAAITCDCNLCRSACRFCNAIAQNVIKSVVDRVEVGGGTRYVASLMSNGSIGCVPVAVKYGEQPICLRIVMRLAQNTEYVACDHFT